MEKINKNASQTLEKASDSLANMAHDMSETVVQVIEKLAGKESNIKLSFENLTLEMGPMKTTVSGAIVLDLVYAKDAETKAKSRSESSKSKF